MKSIRFFKIKNYDVIYGVSPVLINPEETKIAISQALDISPDEVLALENLDGLTEQYAVYPQPGPDELHVSDDEGTEIESKLASLEEHTRLTVQDEVVSDWIGVKYHLKVNGAWTEAEITDIGETPPEGFVLPEDLTKEQREEIAAQKETGRIAALTPEARAEELQARLDALADEADRLARRAQIQGKAFDAAAWYQENKSPVELKYAS
jgi:hypothetical protein